MDNIFYNKSYRTRNRKNKVVNLILNGQSLLHIYTPSEEVVIKVVNLILNGQSLLLLEGAKENLEGKGRKPYSKWTISSTMAKEGSRLGILSS